MSSDISISPLHNSDLAAADRVMRIAFGTFIGVPDPESFFGDKSYVQTRWLADPHAAFGAKAGNELIGSNFATNWGSVGFLGPLTIRPDYWDRGVGKLLMEPVMDLFNTWGIKHAGLFTFSHSPKHVGLYQRFGFWPGFLTVLVGKPIEEAAPFSGWSKFSELPESEEEATIQSCYELTSSVYDGLNVECEIRAVLMQGLGDTILLSDEQGLAALAVCHTGPGTEAGTGFCYIKFAAVRPGAAVQRNFEQLLKACESFGFESGATQLVAGINTGRHRAYRQMLELGFKIERQGVAMHRPNEPGYDRDDVYVIDDWR